MKQLLDDLCALISIKDAQAALEFMLSRAEQEGFSTKNLDGLCGYVDFGEGADIFAILCHLDVVAAGEGWTADPFRARIENGRLYGRGALDDKGPAVMAFYAMKAVRDQGLMPSMKIRLILGTDEESGAWRCMARYKETEQAPAMAVTPDGDYPVINREKGIAHYRVFCGARGDFTLTSTQTINMVPDFCEAVLPGGETLRASGKAAHASTPQEGENAILKLLAAHPLEHPLTDFARTYMDLTGEALGISQSDDSGPLTLNAGILNICDKNAELCIDIRYPISANEDKIFETLAQKAAPYGLSVSRLSVQPPLYVDGKSPFVTALLKVYEEVTGEAAAPIAIGGGTYARAFSNAVCFGACFPDTPAVMHQKDEFISLSDLEKNLAIYTRMLAVLCCK